MEYKTLTLPESTAKVKVGEICHVSDTLAIPFKLLTIGDLKRIQKDADAFKAKQDEDEDVRAKMVDLVNRSFKLIHGEDIPDDGYLDVANFYFMGCMELAKFRQSDVAKRAIDITFGSDRNPVRVEVPKPTIKMLRDVEEVEDSLLEKARVLAPDAELDENAHARGIAQLVNNFFTKAAWRDKRPVN